MPTPSDLAALLSDGRALTDELVGLRRTLHATPEVGDDLPVTQAAVLAALDGLGLEVRPGEATRSVTAVLRGSRPGPAVLLRADMDALPVTEDSGEPFASAVPGRMHACGHDLHVAALVGAARLLAARREQLAGSVVLAFQTGEETGTGALAMLAEGLLDAAGEPVAAAYALHVLAALLPAGVVTTRGGALMAGADTVVVTVRGGGGHGSMPHLTTDPVPALAEIVTSLHTMTTRRVDPFDPVVLTVGTLAAGTASNVIATRASLSATLRTFSADARERVLDGVHAVCTGVAAAHGVDVEVDVHADVPVTSNTPAEAARVLRVAAALLGPARVFEAPFPVTGSEDFAEVLGRVPGAYFAIGATAPGADPATAPYNHSPQARFDDRVLGDAAALLAGLAWDRLAAG